MLIIPAEPGLTATDGLNHTLERLKKIGHTKYKILLTKIPPFPQTEGQQLYSYLVAAGHPVLKTKIPFLVAYVIRMHVNQPEFFCNTCDARFMEDEVQVVVPLVPATDIKYPFCWKLYHVEKFDKLGVYPCPHRNHTIA